MVLTVQATFKNLMMMMMMMMMDVKEELRHSHLVYSCSVM